MDAVLTSLREALAPLEGEDPFAVGMPSVEDLAKNRNLNPTGRELDAQEVGMLASLLQEYGTKLRKRSYDRYLATNLSYIEAIRRRDFAEKPNGSDPDGIARRASLEAQERFASRPGDSNIAELPGANLGHNRIVIFHRSDYPGYFEALDAQRDTRAEYDLALRTFFLTVR
jgi:hypothetical protein